jgi:hypothetical protein
MFCWWLVESRQKFERFSYWLVEKVRCACLLSRREHALWYHGYRRLLSSPVAAVVSCAAVILAHAYPWQMIFLRHGRKCKACHNKEPHTSLQLKGIL